MQAGNVMKNSVIIKWVWKFASKYKRAFMLSYFVLLCELAFAQIYPLFLGDIINASVYDADMTRFLFATIFFALTFLGYEACGFIQLQLWQKLDNKYVYDLRVACYRQILHLKSNILCDIRTGNAISTINNDTLEFHHIVQRYAMRIVNAIIETVISLVIVAMMRWELALLMLIIIPTSVLLSHLIEKRIKKVSDELRDKQGKYSAWLLEMLKGMREIKLFVAEKNVLGIFMDKNSDIIKTSDRQARISFESNQLIGGIYFISNLLFYIISAVFVATGKINIGGYISIATYYTMTTRSIKHVLYANMDYQKRKASVERVVKILESDFEEENGLSEFRVANGDIDIRNLYFSYNGKRDVLKNINLYIKAGEKIGIVGESGTGKSTFAHLLLKLYEPSSGVISVDGQALYECKYSDIRREIGIVSQENIIFDSTVRENITFGAVATDEELWNILEKAYLRSEIEALPQGLDTVLGNLGTSLSGGQNQRLCIARMIFRNPKIIILDEATSALDIESEEIVQSALDWLSEGRTTVIISHRYKSLVGTDRILILKNGEVAGIGNINELMESNEYFKALFATQKVENL